MDKDKKEWAIIGVIALIIVIIYSILMSFQVTYWKHQNIAYEQYREEDLRQARIYNSTFASSNEEFIKKIENYPEQDQTIAKALYEVKPEVDKIKKGLKQGETRKQELNTILNSRPHNVFKDTKSNLSNNYRVYNINDYMRTFEIKDITIEEMHYLSDLFNLSNSSLLEAINKYKVEIIDERPYYDGMEQEIAEIDSKAIQSGNNLSEMKANINKIIQENSPTLEYQDTIITNGIKTASDYLFTI